MELSQLPPLIGGRYRPIRKIGEGSAGFVFEVEHVRTGDRLALKLMRMHAGPLPAVAERFKREARAATRLKSENVVRVIDADAAPELDDALYIVMEHLEGTDLERACGAVPQPPELVVEWLRQTAHGLDRAHALGIVHRDLKPENLFLTEDEHGEPCVKILDFGIARTLDDAPGTTQTGQLLGTPLFMSPEHARAAGEIGPAADRYALGLIAYRLLAGDDYWESSPNIAAIIAQILYHPMVPPSARGLCLGDAFDAWFARACHRDPERRFETALELVQELAASLGVRVSGPSFYPDRHSLPRPFSGGIQMGASGLPNASDTSSAPTLGSATRDLPDMRRRTQRTRWVALTAFLVILVAVFWLTLGRRDAPTAGDAATPLGPAPPAAAAQTKPTTIPTPSASLLTVLPNVTATAVERARSASPPTSFSADLAARPPAVAVPGADRAAPRSAAQRHTAKLNPSSDDPLADQK
jgi:serine/threonine protein kinase